MKPKNFFSCLCATGSFAAVVLLCSCNSQETALREKEQELQTVRAELDQVKTAGSAQKDEITRLRKDNEDLLRLRNEVRQLRDEKKQLTQQAQAAQAEVQRAQTQIQAAQSQVQTLSTNLSAAQALAVQQHELAARNAASLSGAQMIANACLNNLRQIDAAKQQWALENKKTAETVPSATDITPYLKDGIPKCPGGGIYTLNAVGVVATCSIPGHALTQ